MKYSSHHSFFLILQARLTIAVSTIFISTMQVLVRQHHCRICSKAICNSCSLGEMHDTTTCLYLRVRSFYSLLNCSLTNNWIPDVFLPLLTIHLLSPLTYLSSPVLSYSFLSCSVLSCPVIQDVLLVQSMALGSPCGAVAPVRDRGSKMSILIPSPCLNTLSCI